MTVVYQILIFLNRKFPRLMIRHALPLILTFCITLNAAAQNPGVIKGRVNFFGDIPAPEVLKVSGDKVCEDLTRNKPPLREDVIVSADKTLANVVVWVDSGWPDGGKPGAKAAPAVTLLQQNCSFYPHVVAVQTGQEVVVVNKDDTLHNVNALPKNNPRLNKAMIGKSAPPVKLVFSNPEVAIKIKDDIHPWMTAWVAVLDHPAFDVTSDDGRFEIKDLPVGEYVLKAWHEKFGTASTTVLVKKEEPAEVTFEFTSTGVKAGNKAESGDGTVPVGK